MAESYSITEAGEGQPQRSALATKLNSQKKVA